VVLAALAEHLAAARRVGRPFAEAWPAAFAAATVSVGPAHEREQWRAALHATRVAWQAGYERCDAPDEQRAVLALLDPDEREPLDAEVDTGRAAA
jgi:hypothetical protein